MSQDRVRSVFPPPPNKLRVALLGLGFPLLLSLSRPFWSDTVQVLNTFANDIHFFKNRGGDGILACSAQAPVTLVPHFYPGRLLGGTIKTATLEFSV